ncbi:thiamine diphosphokinase [Bacillaceae bacterium W0354]
MTIIGIIAGGPKKGVPPLTYFNQINYWIGVDEGNVTLLDKGLIPNIAIGDFDSVDKETFHRIQQYSKSVQKFPVEKDATDLELAIQEAIELSPDKVFIFRATGGRLDHEWMNIMLLKQFAENNIDAWIVDDQNEITLKLPGEFQLYKDERYKYISFLPVSEEVKGLNLKGFLYELSDQTIQLGTSLTVSNEWNEKKGTYFFSSGILLVIKSRDSTL